MPGHYNKPGIRIEGGGKVDLVIRADISTLKSSFKKNLKGKVQGKVQRKAMLKSWEDRNLMNRGTKLNPGTIRAGVPQGEDKNR